MDSTPTLDSDQTQSVYSILDYNQQLIQFADAKAGNLIVVNSLFIAAAQAGSAAPPLVLRIVQGVLILLAGLAVLQCLGVIMLQTRLPRLPRKDCIFFGDITQRRSPQQFVEEFTSTPADEHAQDGLRRVYVLALIARNKFSGVGWAQRTTVAAALCWLSHAALQVVLR